MRTLEDLIAKWRARAEWAASDTCPGDFYPQDAFGECVDDLEALAASPQTLTTPVRAIVKIATISDDHDGAVAHSER